MQKSYLEVIEQFILDTNMKRPGLSEADRFNKAVKLEGLEYDSFLFNAFKRVEKELDKIDVVKAIEAGMGYRYFNYLRVVAKVLDCPNYMSTHAVGNFINDSIGLVLTDTPVLDYMVDRAQYVSDAGWLIKVLSASSGYWVDTIVLQTRRELPAKHRGMFVNAQNGNTFGYVANFDNVTNTMNVDWDGKDNELAYTGFLSTAQAMVRAIDYYGLTKYSGELVHVGFKDNVFLHITYP